jgi:hypothetical protein
LSFALSGSNACPFVQGSAAEGVGGFPESERCDWFGGGLVDRMWFGKEVREVDEEKMDWSRQR